MTPPRDSCDEEIILFLWEILPEETKINFMAPWRNLYIQLVYISIAQRQDGNANSSLFNASLIYEGFPNA